ncbi:ECF transporter S component [Macrococcus armenti]|uniref:Riboflavin transporter n=1 Tax=Macrococcus armenti TaxID=2875764 RepID=A0ABY3ZSC7_9STAP|nr:ECF transporter S component [Macrococcus armenti]UOB19677.1 ECF transporter S component [Macrococcus armenti]
MTQFNKTRRLIIVSLLSAIAFLLMFLKFPLPFLPPYLTVDLSDVPAIIALFTVGPVGAIGVEIIKNILNFLINMADPIGPLANFLAGSSFVLTLFIITKGRKHKLLIGFICAVVVMTIVMSLMNYFVLLPLYGMIMNFSDIAANLKVIITTGIIPFNIIKGLIVSVIAAILIKMLPRLI